jgi:predicted alpha-1,2-mannosidase
MHKILSAIIGIFFLFSCTSETKIKTEFNAVQYVDPQIGSVHGRWFFYTPAALPFGMAKIAPHTNAYESLGSWLPGGYDDRHTSIEGFGHFHEFQIGGVVVMPTVGPLKTIPGTLENPDEGYRSRFDKKDEYAKPGYYSVFLKDYQLKAELTATERVGFHRYTFPESKESRLIFDIGHKQGESSDVMEAFAQLVNNNEIEGYVETYPEYAKFCDPGNYVKMYFVAQLSKKPSFVGTFIDSKIQPNDSTTKGVRNGIFITFETAENEVVEMQVGLSYTSIENARLNLVTEATGKSFDEVHRAATRRWNEMLERIRVDDSNEENKIKFYTGLYHALLGRGIASDVNGLYKLNGEGIGQIPLDENGKPRYNHINTDGMWGGFWNINFYKETGWLHDGEAAGVYTNGVQTNFQGLLIASAYNCGFRDFDWETGYEAAVKNELEYRGRNLGNGKYDLYYFVKNGYVPYQDTIIGNGWVFNFGASHTLEYAFSSYAVAQMAKNRGNEADYSKLMEQAGYWKNLFDSESKFIRPKLPSGEFIKDFDPMKAWDGFQEGNAYQFTWFVPHDIAGLIENIGKDLFNERLEKTFEESRKSLFGGGEEIHSFSGVEMLYNQGNQPCLHQSWLFNYSGKPWLTQKWTRIICDEFYGTEPLHGYGFGQDEDQGQLGAWYVMAALGLFDVQGHTNAEPTFQFGSPLFEKVSIQLSEDPGNRLVIETKDNGPENYYVRSLKFNGETIENTWLKRETLMQGGKLVFEMDSVPNKNRGAKVPPPSMNDEWKQN